MLRLELARLPLRLRPLPPVRLLPGQSRHKGGSECRQLLNKMLELLVAKPAQTRHNGGSQCRQLSNNMLELLVVNPAQTRYKGGSKCRQLRRSISTVCSRRRQWQRR